MTYLVQQLEHMISRMEQEFEVDMSPDSLRLAAEYSNQARSYFGRVLELLQGHQLPGVSRELQEIFGMNCFGAKENVQICRALYEEASELVKGEANQGKRVLWIGQVPEESHELLRYVRQAVDLIFWAPLWEANMRMLDADRPLRDIAERAMLYHWNAERMAAEMARICEAYTIEGFLIVNVWGCRNMMGVSPVFRDIARSKKLKYLTINIDLVDRNNYSFSHVKNRVDGFLELMH